MAKHIVARLSEIPAGQRKRVTVRGRDIVVINHEGEFFALLNRCPHMGADLCAGKLVGVVQSDEPGSYKLSRPNEMLRCPWHGWEYDIRTGQSYCDPSNITVKNYEVSVEAGEELVKGPYVAETFPVLIEDAYVVVEL